MDPRFQKFLNSFEKDQKFAQTLSNATKYQNDNIQEMLKNYYHTLHHDYVSREGGNSNTPTTLQNANVQKKISKKEQKCP